MQHKPRKRFGQNFLHDQFVISKIVSAVKPTSNDHFIEIGPGLGAITASVLSVAKRLDAVEIDQNLIPVLADKFANYKNFQLHQSDILKFDVSALTSDKNSLRCIGNLPYNISTPLLFKLLEDIDLIHDMHFMLQKEVAQRITAQPNSKQYGRLSIMMQYHCDTDYLFEVPPESFDPQPKVYSAIIKLTPRKQKSVIAKDLNCLQTVLTAAFNQRRKTIYNSLKKLLDKDDFCKLNIDPQLRAEQISVEEFVKISNYIQ